MLRSSFLAYSPDRFITLVQGSLQLLDVSSLVLPLPPAASQTQTQTWRRNQEHDLCPDDLNIESWIISSAINASPDSMNLLSDRIAVMDLGNFILIRAGVDVEDAG